MVDPCRDRFAQHRERAVAIVPMQDGMVLHTLHEKSDIYDPRTLFEPAAGEKPDPDMIQLALQLVDRQTASFEPSDMEDHYEARLREVIAAKLQGEGIAQPAEPETPRRDNVVDLMAALKQSLQRAGGSARESRPASGTGKVVRHPAAKSTPIKAAPGKATSAKAAAAKAPAVKAAKKRAPARSPADTARASSGRKRA